MPIIFYAAIAHCLVGLYLLAFSRPFRTSIWGPMPPMATLQMFLLTLTFGNEFDPEKTKSLPEWLGYPLGYFLLATTGITAVACWPFVLIKQRREAKALRLRLNEYDKQRDAEITAAYTAPLPAEQDWKTFGELWEAHKGNELPKYIVIIIRTWDIAHLDGADDNYCEFTLQGDTYTYLTRRGGNRVELATEEVRAFIGLLQSYPLVRKRPAHLDRSFDYSGEVTEIKIVFSDLAEGSAQSVGPTIEIEHRHGETTCVHYIGSHTDSDSLRRRNPCWLVGGAVEAVCADFACSVSARGHS